MRDKIHIKHSVNGLSISLNYLLSDNIESKLTQEKSLQNVRTCYAKTYSPSSRKMRTVSMRRHPDKSAKSCVASASLLMKKYSDNKKAKKWVSKLHQKKKSPAKQERDRRRYQKHRQFRREKDTPSLTELDSHIIKHVIEPDCDDDPLWRHLYELLELPLHGLESDSECSDLDSDFKCMDTAIRICFNCVFCMGIT